MPTPSHSIIFWAPPANAQSLVNVGDVLIPSASTPGAWVVATSANRGTRRAEGVAISNTSGSGFGAVEIQQAGTLDASIAGLGSGPKALVRVSSAGRLERVQTFGTGDDIVGIAEEDGRVHLMIGLPFQQLKDAATVGEVNTASNVGTTGNGSAGVFKQKTGVNLEMRRLVAGSNVTLSESASDITIGAAASGETNTASNVGTTGAGTAGVFKQKTGVNLEMRRLVAGSNVTLTENANDITVAASGGSGFTAGGDLSGTNTSQTVVGVRATTVGTAGGALATGAVLRTTGTTSCDWGAVDLSSSNARTGTLPVGNGGTGQTAVPGVSGSLLVNSGGNYGAASWTTSGDGIVSTSSNAAFVAVGSSPSQTGLLRLPWGQGVNVRHATAARDTALITSETVSGTTQLRIGNYFGSTADADLLRIYAGYTTFHSTNYVFYSSSVSNTPILNMGGGVIRANFPIIGDAAYQGPYSVHGVASITVPLTGTLTVAASEYDKQVLIFVMNSLLNESTTTIIFPNPSSQTVSYTKDLILRPTSGGIEQNLVISCGSATKTVRLGSSGILRARCLFQPNEVLALSAVTNSDLTTMSNTYYA